MGNSIAEQFQQVSNALSAADKIFIAAHENPDADAVGSVLAFNYFLRSWNKETFCYLPDSPPSQLNFLPGFLDIHTSFDSLPPPLDFWAGNKDFDIFLCLDYGDFKRLRLPKDIDEEKIITIDHHPEGDQRGFLKIINPNVSSTAELIYLWAENFYFENSSRLFLTKEIATCLLAGIIFDTGGFSHVSTSSQTLKIVSRLISLGAPLTKSFKNIYSPVDYWAVSGIWGKILSRIEQNQQTGLIYSWLSSDEVAEYQGNLSELARVSSFLSAVSESKISLFLVEREKGKIDGSLRSEPYKGREVAVLAEALGGGGHPYAAGFCQEGTIDSVLKKVIKLLE